MALIDFTSELTEAGSLLDLARRLCAICEANWKELGEILLAQRSSELADRLEAEVAAVQRGVWEALVADPSDFEGRVGPQLAASIQLARKRQPLEFLGIARGLCRGPIPEVYLACEGRIALDRGTPVPFAEREKPPGVEWTTKVPTMGRANLLDRLPVAPFPYSAGDRVKAVLDFSHRERIDELTANGPQGLPRIAMLHPEESGEVRAESIDDGRFFDVRPARPDPERLLELISSLAEEAEIAVLPELCLSRPDELEDALAAEPGRYPPLVVAGSAHVRAVAANGEEIRANESRVYLDGERVAVHRKHHPFATSSLDGKRYPEELIEDITGEQKTITVLAGTRTRLAVVICADLLDQRIPQMLIAAGVNLLLAPAMTRKTGSFRTPVIDVSGYCQGVSAVANARLSASGQPFLCLVRTPRESPSEQVAELTGAGVVPPPVMAIFDSNLPLPGAVSWR
jgi:hypothetical protein